MVLRSGRRDQQQGMDSERGDARVGAGLGSDPAVLAAIYRDHVDAVVRYAARRCSQPADVADLVAATFLAVLESSAGPKSTAGYDPAKGDLRPWILGIASRLHANRSRRGGRERGATARTAGRRLLDSDDISRLEERIDAARETPWVERAVQQLPPRHREVLWLVGYDGLSHEDAARVLDISPASLRMRLTRARRSLRRSLPADAGPNATNLSSSFTPPSPYTPPSRYAPPSPYTPEARP